ncbi:magnesium chelatase [Halobacteriales archaeon QS_4_69_225]|nr:MAG: magnesium chelatase [Halobacteriales archaeon QS_4_69_225]
MSDPAALYESLREEAAEVLVGNERLIEGLTVAALSGGHVLLEGVPGVAKTTAASLFARASGLEYARVQMTPDLLPADITGTRVYRQDTGSFEFTEGPVFANVVVADEINRATPKTQSALLESMQEEQVTVDGETRTLPSPFLVIATQNPIEMEGVFALPEAQRDRFQQKLVVDVPGRDDERAMLDRFDENPELNADDVDPVVTPAELLACKEVVGDVHVAPRVKEYVIDLVDATRAHDAVEHGASPRATVTFLDAAKARAAVRGRGYVIPDDLKALAESVLAHRLVLDTDAGLRGIDPTAIVAEAVAGVEPPATGTDPDADGADPPRTAGSSPPVEVEGDGAGVGYSGSDDA